MAKNSGALILGLLALWYISQKPKGASNGSSWFFGNGSRHTVAYYPVGYREAVLRTQGDYGAGSQAELPDIQDYIEQKHIESITDVSRLRTRTTRQRQRRTLEKSAIIKTQAQYGKGSTARIPVVQDLIEARRR